MTVANLLMPVAGLIKVEMLFQFVSVSFMFWSNSLIKVETLFYFFSSFSVAFWSIGSSRWNYLFFHLFFPMFTPTQTLSLKFIVIFYPECKYASMCRLGTVERKRTLTHLSSSFTIAPPPPFSSFAVSLSLPMTSLVSNGLGMGEFLVRNVNMMMMTKSFFPKAQPSPALDPKACLEACSTPTAGSCPPSG